MNLRLRRRLAYLALIWAFSAFGILGTSPPVASGVSAPSNDPSPLYDEWTPTTQVYRNVDGTLTMTVWAGPVQAEDASSPSGWSPIDTTLQTSDDAIEPQHTETAIEFSPGFDSGPLASMAEDSASISLDLGGTLQPPIVEEDTATYEDVMPGVDATLQARPAGFEESFVVDKASDAPLVVDIPLSLNGLTASLSDGGALVLTDDLGAVVGGADPALMWGAGTDPLTGEPVVQELVATSLIDDGNGPVLRLTPDPSFFVDPAVTYPVTIDPAVSLTLTVDTYVDSSNPTTGYASANILRSGKWTTAGTYRSFIGFDSSLIAGAHVLSASLALQETGAGSCTPTQVDLYSVTNTVIPPVTWNNQPTRGSLYASASSAYGASSCPSPGIVTLSAGGANGDTLTTLVQRWADGASTPPIAEIAAHDETDPTASKVFTSSEGGSNGPALSVTYNSYPDPPSELATEYPQDYPVLHGTFSDPDGGVGQVLYTIYNATGTPVLSDAAGSTVTAGSDSPYTIPSGTLAPNTLYSWTARSSDGTDYSVTTSEPDLVATSFPPASADSNPWGCTLDALNPHNSSNNYDYIKAEGRVDCTTLLTGHTIEVLQDLYRSSYSGWRYVGENDSKCDSGSHYSGQPTPQCNSGYTSRRMQAYVWWNCVAAGFKGDKYNYLQQSWGWIYASQTYTAYDSNQTGNWYDPGIINCRGQ